MNRDPSDVHPDGRAQQNPAVIQHFVLQDASITPETPCEERHSRSSLERSCRTMDFCFITTIRVPRLMCRVKSRIRQMIFLPSRRNYCDLWDDFPSGVHQDAQAPHYPTGAQQWRIGRCTQSTSTNALRKKHHHPLRLIWFCRTRDRIRQMIFLPSRRNYCDLWDDFPVDPSHRDPSDVHQDAQAPHYPTGARQWHIRRFENHPWD